MVYVPYISSRLPSYDGPYPVGALDLELPVDKPDTQPSASFRLGSDPVPLKLESVLFSLYYPTNKSDVKKGKKKHPYWFVRPFVSTAKGYAKLAEISSTFAVSFAHSLARTTKIPAYANVPLAECPSGKWPLIIFSHGLGGQRRMYSHLCGSLAAHGYIVAAIEHRDGSAPSTWVYPPLNEKYEQGEPRNISWYDWKQISFEDDPTKNESHVPLRDEQLDFRLRELEQVWNRLREISKGEGNKAELTNHRKNVSGSARNVDWKSFERFMDSEKDVTFMGHSFGGATVFRVATKSDGFVRCITLDPWSWWEIFPKDAISFPVFTPPHFDIRVPLLTINSEQFTVWDDNFRSVYDLHRQNTDKYTWLLTLCGSLHSSFSDFNLMAPRLSRYRGLRVKPKRALALVVDAVREFTSQPIRNDNSPSLHSHTPTSESEFSLCNVAEHNHQCNILDIRRKERPYELANEDKESMLKRWPPRLPPASKELINMRIGSPGHFILHVKPNHDYKETNINNKIPSTYLPSNQNQNESSHLAYDVTTAHC